MDTTYVPQKGGRAATQPTTQPTSGPALSESPILRLSLQEVVHRAVNNNMEIRIAGYDPAIDSNRVIEAEAAFDPTFFVTPGYEWKNVQLPGQLIGGPNAVTTGFEQRQETYSFASGIRQQMETGGTGELRYETSRSYNSPTNTVFNPYYTNNLVAEIKQPLLKNFGVEVNRARITVARNDQRISMLEFRKKLEETLYNVEDTYWRLVLAEADVKISEDLLSRTIETAELLARRGTQDITRVQTSQANSAVQSRRALLIRARAHVRDLSGQIKRLMNDPELPVASNVVVLPASSPIKSPIHFNPADQVNQALEHRFELGQQLLRIDSASLVTRVAKNNLLPTLNANSAVTVNGSEANWTSTNTDQFEFSHIGYKLGLQLEIPIGNRQARAVYQRTLLQRQQQVDTYRNLIEQVSLEVDTALRNVQTSWDETIANRQAVLANADALDSIVLREKDGNEPLTYSFVQLKLDTQARLADAARNEAQSISTYCTAIAALERSKGTLLRYDNVMMDEDRLGVIVRSKIAENIPQPILPGLDPNKGQ